MKKQDKFFWKYKKEIRYLMVDGELLETINCEDFKKIVMTLENELKRLRKERDAYKRIAQKQKNKD
ncbi:hypothetical protein ES703_109706 [subsurface metagenome]